jgi:hypothetical protein
MLRTLRRDSRRAKCQLLEPQTQRLDAAGRIDRACRTAVDMYTNLEKLAALRYCYDLGGCVTVKIASIQGSKRLTFCPPTGIQPAGRRPRKIGIQPAGGVAKAVFGRVGRILLYIEIGGR